MILAAVALLLATDNLGVIVKGKLVPEVVKHGKIEIAKYEVTCAQYFAWDNGYPMRPGSENLPATGITPAQARGYAEWLSGVTGDTWRLPAKEELKGAEKLDPKVAEWTSNGKPNGDGFRVVREKKK